MLRKPKKEAHPSTVGLLPAVWFATVSVSPVMYMEIKSLVIHARLVFPGVSVSIVTAWNLQILIFFHFRKFLLV